ncbi:endonuclease/exonuclease/phosphatase family protein [Bacteroidota bacterium]
MIIPKGLACIAVTLLLSIGHRATALAQSPPILVDGRFNEWEQRVPAYDGSAGPQTAGIDFGRIWIESSSDFLLIAFELDQELLIQENNRLAIYLDTDMNSATGAQAGGLGAELVWTFGERRGTLHPPSGTRSVDQADIGIVSAPTVSSTRFEFAMPLDVTPGGWQLFSSDSLRILLVDQNSGSQAPEPGEVISVAISRDASVVRGTEDLTRANGILRLLTYNVENDGLFDPALTTSFGRILAAVDPDVILFVEIYDHSSGQTADRVEQFLPSGLGHQWYAASTGSDVIIVSRFPILRSFAIRGTQTSGNSAFLIDLSRQFDGEFLVVGAHLPCCGGADNNEERQQEADELMAFVRDIKADGSIANRTPFVITGDLNLVGDSQQLRTLVTGEIVTDVFAPSFGPDWNGTDLADLTPPVTGTPLTYTWENRQSTFQPGRLDFFIYTDAVTGIGKRFALDSGQMSSQALMRAGLARIDTGIASDHLPVAADFDFKIPTSTTPFEFPQDLSALKVYPNPGSGRINLEFGLKHAGRIQMRISDILGRPMTTITRPSLNAGQHSLSVDLDIPSGLYIATLIGPIQRTSTKFVVVH